MMRSKRRQASGRVGLVFKVVIPVLDVDHSILRRGRRTVFGPCLESHDRWLVVEMRKGGHGAMCEKGSGRRSLEDEIEQRGSSDSDSDLQMSGRSFARWRKKWSSGDYDDGAIGKKEKRRG